MEEQSQPNFLSNCSNFSEVADYVKNKIELCIQNYMSLDVTAKYLEKNHRISKSVTHIVWEQLREENPVFFNHFDLRCQTANQMRMFNDMLTKQAVGMFENGLIDICDVSPSVRNLLRQQHPERVHLLETLASKRKLSSASVTLAHANSPLVAPTQILYNQQDQVLNSASFAMPNANGPSAAHSLNPYGQENQFFHSARLALSNPNGPSVVHSHMSEDQFNSFFYSAIIASPDANGPSVTQLPIPYAQQDQQHLYTTSLPLPAANGPSMTQPPVPYDQQDHQHLYTTNMPLPYANGPSVTQLPIPNNQQDQHLYTTSLPLPTANGPSMTQLPIPNNQQTQPHQNPLPTYNNDPNSPTFATEDTDEDWLLLIDPATFSDLGVLPPLPPADTTNPWSSSDYISWTDEAMPGDLSRFDITPPMQTDTSVHQQQAGGVNHHHHPESEAQNAQLVMQPSELNGHYQPQQNVPVETLQRGGNGVVNGESNDKSHSKRMCTSVDESGSVKRHHPEPEALNNPNSGNGTQTTGVDQQRSPNARATTRYESEETKQ